MDSPTDWLTDQLTPIVDLIDVTLAGEDAYSKAVNVLTDAPVGLVESIGDSRQLGMETVTTWHH